MDSQIYLLNNGGTALPICITFCSGPSKKLSGND